MSLEVGVIQVCWCSRQLRKMEDEKEDDNFRIQLKEYSHSKQREFLAKKAPASRAVRSVPNELTPLVLRSRPALSPDSIEESRCCCIRESLANYCANCQCLSSSVQLGYIPISHSGVPLRIHYSWPFFLLLSAFPAFYTSAVVGIFSLVLAGPILFITVLLHEMGHAVVAIRLGGEVSQILLWPLGGLAYISFFGDSNLKADALIAIAGPLTHVPQFLLWYLAMYVTNRGVVNLFWPINWGNDFWLALCSAAMVLQITLFVFNLIPAYPLDGGRLLGALLSWLTFSRNTVFKVTAFVGSIFGFFFLFEGLRSASSKEFTFYSSGNEMAIGVFILMNCVELWMLGSREAADLHPGYEWADGRQHSHSQQAPPTHLSGRGSEPHRGGSNIHGPGDAVGEAHHRDPVGLGPQVGKSGNNNYNRDAPKIPGVGRRLGISDEMV